jgi:membrane fusion protein (multidrug efflux system)
MKISNNKKIIAIISSLITSLAVYYFFFNTAVEKQNFRPTPFVEVTAAKKMEISDQVDALGTAIANESVNITSNVTEIIDEIKFIDNMTVKKGDDIVILQADEEIAQRKAEELQLKEHQRELKRLRKLVSRKAATKQLFDQRKTLMEISEQKIIEIDAKISDRIIKAPFDGILGLRYISKGALVRPGELITTIDDISKIKIDFWIPSIYLSKIYVEMPISAKTEAYEGKEFKGAASFIDSRVDENTRSVKVRAVIENEDLLLRPGLLLNVTLFNDIRDAILINEEALVAKQDKHYLFVLNDDNTVLKKEVNIGVRQNGMVEIKNNLVEGERVVIKGVLKIRNGSIVKVLSKEKSN